jgi:hypothetical protein
MSNGVTDEAFVSGTRVVILSSGSVFVESIASRLRQQLKANNVQTIDSRQADVLERVVAAQPAIVIAETTDVKLEQPCAMSGLLAALPKLTVIRLDPQQEHMQVVTSEQRPAGGMSGLIRAIQSARGQRSKVWAAQRPTTKPGPGTRKEHKKGRN